MVAHSLTYYLSYLVITYNSNSLAELLQPTNTGGKNAEKLQEYDMGGNVGQSWLSGDHKK